MANVRVLHRALAVGIFALSIFLAAAPANAAWRGNWHSGGVWHGGGVWRGGAWGGGGVWRGGRWGGGAWGGPGWGYRPWVYRPWGVGVYRPWNPWIGVASLPIFVPPYPAYDVYEDEPGVCELRRVWIRGPFGWHRVRQRVCW